MDLPMDIQTEIGDGNLSKVKEMVEKDPQVVNRVLVNDTRLVLMATPIHVASAFNKVDILTYLLDHGADINHQTQVQAVTIPNSLEMHGCTALHLACMYGHYKVVDLLLERGADPTIVISGDGATALIRATRDESVECLRHLLGHDLAKTTVNARSEVGMTALHYACLQNDKEMVKLLLEAGADISAVDKGGFTPMSTAQEKRHKGIVRVLQVSPMVYWRRLRALMGGTR